MADEIGFFEAYENVLAPLFAASNLVQLLGRAEDTGALQFLRRPVSVHDLGRSVGLADDVAGALCDALVAAGVADRDRDLVVLSPPWLALTAPGAYVPLGVALAGHHVEGTLLRSAATYWSMPSPDRLAYARAVSPDPYSDDLVTAFRAQIEADPDRSAMCDGGRLLELGCGLAGRLLTTLRAMPKLTAVGVELSGDLAAEAQRRTADLGLADRLKIVCADATAFVDDRPFDFGFWSQFFFPESARAGALRSLMVCLRSGAVVLAPLGVDFGAIDADPRGAEARDYALWRLVLQSWGVPERRPADLVAEFEASGFVDVRVADGAGPPLVRAARP